MSKIEIGDYVIAEFAQFDDFTGITWSVVEFTRNMLGQECVRVQNIARPDQSTTLFYPHELVFEDGSIPSR